MQGRPRRERRVCKGKRCGRFRSSRSSFSTREVKGGLGERGKTRVKDQVCKGHIVKGHEYNAKEAGWFTSKW